MEGPCERKLVSLSQRKVRRDSSELRYLADYSTIIYYESFDQSVGGKKKENKKRSK